MKMIISTVIDKSITYYLVAGLISSGVNQRIRAVISNHTVDLRSKMRSIFIDGKSQIKK